MTSRDNKRAERVWARMVQSYGARWAESFGPKPSDDWTDAVSRASDAQIATALVDIRRKHLSHPPTLPEFEAALRAARPHVGASFGPSTIDRLDAAMSRARPEAKAYTWLAQRNADGSLEICGVMVQQTDRYPAHRILASELGDSRNAA